MATRTTSLLASLLALAIFASQALGQELPEQRTHVDPAEVVAGTAAADPDSPLVTFIKGDTKARDLRAGSLYVLVRCDARCIVEVTATTKISGKQREVARTRKKLAANKTTRIRLKIRSDVRQRVRAGATIRFTAVPQPVA
jgi:hypothetical protein